MHSIAVADCRVDKPLPHTQRYHQTRTAAAAARWLIQSYSTSLCPEASPVAARVCHKVCDQAQVAGVHPNAIGTKHSLQHNV
jgi:hypothetical protein